jgi:hypothetical protein
MTRDLAWIIIALCGIVVIPIVLLYVGLFGLMGVGYAWHRGDWESILALTGVFFGGPLVLGLFVYGLFKRPSHLAGDNRIRVASRRIQLPHQKFEREHGRQSDEPAKTTF